MSKLFLDQSSEEINLHKTDLGKKQQPVYLRLDLVSCRQVTVSFLDQSHVETVSFLDQSHVETVSFRDQSRDKYFTH